MDFAKMGQWIFAIGGQSFAIGSIFAPARGPVDNVDKIAKAPYNN